MSSCLIQLLTRRHFKAQASTESLQWWNQFQQEYAQDFAFVSQATLDPRAAVVLILRQELTEFRKEEFSAQKTYVLVDHRWTGVSLKRALQLMRGALFFDLTQSLPTLKTILNVAIARQEERERQHSIVQAMREQSRQIEELDSSLQAVVKERTLNEADQRQASRKNISRVREIIGFIKELSRVFEISDLLPLIRKQLKEHHALEAPILFVPKSEHNGDIYYMRASQALRSAPSLVSRVRAIWEASARIRVNQPEDSFFLANALQRPFAKVIRFPLITVRHQRDPSFSPLLFFEHHFSADELDDLVSDLAEKLQPVSWALDRLVLEQELKSASRDWEMTFDDLSEPIAILDHDGHVLRNNSQWQSEFKNVLDKSTDKLRLGDKLFTIERYPIRMSADGPPISWVVYLRDETRSRKLKSQMIQVEKMSAIGQLAGHIAHELNNPLTGIRSLAQVLLTEIPSHQQMHSDLDEVERASARCQGIINNLLDFSKMGLNQKIQVMDLNEITKRTLPLLKSAIGRFRNEVDLSESELLIRVEPHLLQQVIFNLVNNACQAMQNKGEIQVRTRREEKWAILEVRDSGPGIGEDLQERIFEPFFTTKAEGEGTGLGLSFSRDFVREFGGEIELESKTGEGSIFRVKLPLEPEI